MMDALRRRWRNWRGNPRRWQPSYVAASIAAILSADRERRRESSQLASLLAPTLSGEDTTILFDPDFRRSVEEVRNFTLLDIARLANLWNLVRTAGPGTFLEVGTYKGGSALHICNAMKEPVSAFYCFDPFEYGGFERLREEDKEFRTGDFTDGRYKDAARLLSSKPNARIVQGYFPAAAEGLDLDEISFCHLDVAVYEATKDSLAYVASRLARRSLIVVDDAGNRSAPGVDRAIEEFLATHPDFIALPMFPQHAILIPLRHWLSEA